VQKISADGINLPILHDGGLLLAIHGDLEQRVVPGRGAKNLANLLGIYGERNGVILATIKRGRNFARHALAAGFIFAARFADCCFDYDLVCHCLLPFLMTAGP
jgi:hypothetical protein